MSNLGNDGPTFHKLGITFSPLLTKLSQNLLEIVNDKDYYDINIEVGNDPYVNYFVRRILSTNKKKNDGTLAHIKLPNILPETFQVILRFVFKLFTRCLR